MGTASDFELRVSEKVKAAATAEDGGEPPLLWAMEAARLAKESGKEVPSVELAEILVSNLCFDYNTPSLWKILDQAMASRIVFPIHALALLTSRVIPNRHVQPGAYRLYLELLQRYIFTFSSTSYVASEKKMTKAIDDALLLSHTCGIQISDIGQTVVLFFYSVICSLIDSVLEDSELYVEPAENKCTPLVDACLDMDLDSKEDSNEKRNEPRNQLNKSNALVSFEILEKITANKCAKVLLRLIHLNVPEKFNYLLQKLPFINAQRQTSQHVIWMNHKSTKISANIKSAQSGEFHFNKHQLIGSLMGVNSSKCPSYNNSGTILTDCWIPFDIFMEKAMDGRQLHAACAIDIFIGLTRTLRLVNQASWQETFKALWVSALRLVQREREPVEGPIPHLDARLCMLLSITPLTIAGIIKVEDKAKSLNTDGFMDTNIDYKECKEGNVGARRHGLVSALQLLGHYVGLLSPPTSITPAANSAAAKAAAFISDFRRASGHFDGSNLSSTGASLKATGNMLHLIVEACIARGLIDTSAYFWPGYVIISSTSSTDPSPILEPCWSSFMEGAPLSGSLTNALLTTPASSTTQIDKLYHIALNGSEEARSAAAKILCGASLTRGWNIQEHVVHSVVKLLSPPVPSASSESCNHLFGYTTMLHSLLFGLCCIDVVHIISVYGMIPEVAAALIPLCEAFGSLPCKSSSKSITSEEPSAYSVFSCAFLFLLRLWKFFRPPQEHFIAESWANSELTLDYLLLMHNKSASRSISASEKPVLVAALNNKLLTQPVYIGSFPKLQGWYLQNQACMASTLSHVDISNPIHEVANKLLDMISKKTTKYGSLSGSTTSASSNSINEPSASIADDSQLRPSMPAWEVLKAIPCVLEALLTACNNGMLSPRYLTTGLRDLVDFLPASLATIITYFSAEITRGIWKPVHMNGIDWPSPTANLESVESEIKGILSSVGVHFSTYYAGGNKPVMLPLPMAALVGLTITFSLEKRMEYIHGVIGPALEICATSCPLPTMPIIGALWAQKVPRWHDYIIFSCARSPFRQDRDAICQLLRSCFASYLGQPIPPGSCLPTGGVSGLLGSVFLEKGNRLPFAPGFFYFRSCRALLDTRLVSHEVLKLVVASVKEMSSGWICRGPARLKSSKFSLASAAAEVKPIATLAASLICAAGGGRLVQVLFMETMPTFLLSRNDVKAPSASPSSCILEGYALAYMMILSGAFIWGLDGIMQHMTGIALVPQARCARCVSSHIDFIAGALDGNISIGCNPITWKAYVSCFLGLLVRYVPEWVSNMKLESLRILANELKGWHECELAISLLERGGPTAMASVVELIS